MSDPPLQGHWEFPWAGGSRLGSFITRDGRLACSGWTVAERGVPSIEISVDGGLFARTEPSQHREDVEIDLGTRYASASGSTGWGCALDIRQWRPGPHEVAVVARCERGPVSLGRRTIEVSETRPDLAAHWNDLSPLLRCPQTGRPVVKDGDRLRSDEGTAYPIRGHQVFFASQPDAWLGQATSAWGLSAFAQDLIGSCPGSVLIIGAGLGITAPPLVQLDIVDFPNVDVVSDGGTLPFADAAFDGVICENVIEHVPDPFALTAEIDRILKPGGRLGLNGTNMHFTHGYPSHYFNPTEFGMRYLLETRSCFEGTYEFHPVPASLRTVLQFLMKAVDPKLRSQVERLTVGDLMEPSPETRGLLASVPERARRALSTNIYFAGRKKG